MTKNYVMMVAELVAWPLVFFVKHIRFYTSEKLSLEEQVVRHIAAALWGVFTGSLFSCWFLFFEPGKHADWRWIFVIGIPFLSAFIMLATTVAVGSRPVIDEEKVNDTLRG